ncbi:MAG: phosphoribosyltransferase family protein [Solirubrobacterales bacterium]
MDDVIVVSTPRGGVPVAVEIARALHAPLDVMPVVDLSTPGKPEYVVGAVAENAIHVIDSEALAALGVTEDSLAQRVAEATAQIARLAKIYRGERSALTVAGRHVLVVDDGSATAPALEAVAVALTRRKAASLMLATPLTPDPHLRGYSSIANVRHGDELAIVGLWYDDFAAPSDEVAAMVFQEASEVAR